MIGFRVWGLCVCSIYAGCYGYGVLHVHGLKPFAAGLLVSASKSAHAKP